MSQHLAQIETQTTFRDAIANLQGAFDAYVEAIDIIVDDIPDEARFNQAEYELGALFDAYLASLEAKKNLYERPRTPRAPLSATVAEYDQYQMACIAHQKQLTAWERLSEIVEDSATLVHNEILRLLPKYIWFKHPYKEVWIGIETGTWGGGTTDIRVSYKLPERKLEHTTYYP